MNITRREALKIAAGLAVGAALPSIAVADDCVLLDRKDIGYCCYDQVEKNLYCRLVYGEKQLLGWIRESVDNIIDQYIAGPFIKVHFVSSEQRSPVKQPIVWRSFWGVDFPRANRKQEVWAHKYGGSYGNLTYDCWVLQGRTFVLRTSHPACDGFSPW